MHALGPDVILLFLTGTAIGAAIGYLAYARLHRRRLAGLRNDWRDLAYYQELHADRLELDDTRIGINTGVAYAAHKMQSTLDELIERQ